VLRGMKVRGWLLASLLVLPACGRNSSAAFTGPWFDAQGHQVSPGLIQVELGPKRHCGLQSVAFMTLGWPLGSRIEGDFRSFLRDPKGLLLEFAKGKLETDAELPTGATSTGYHHGEWELWIIPSDDRSVYLVSSDRVERWPSGGAGCV
jgi:hypothetical protein